MPDIEFDVKILEEFNKLYEEQIKSFIKSKFERNKFTEPIWYMLDNITSRFRSAIPLLLNENLHQTPRSNIENIKKIAASTEIMYAITLAEDDIIDNDELRWEKPTVWKQIGIGESVAAVGHAKGIVDGIMQDLSCNRKDVILQAYNKSKKDVYKSFMIEKFNKGNLRLSEKDIINLFRLKTVIGVAGDYMAALSIENLLEEECSKVYEYSSLMGIVGQIKDDLMDIYGKKKYRRLSDLKEKYITYPTFLLLNKLKEEVRTETLFDKETYLRLLEQHNIFEECVEDSKEYINDAKKQICFIPDEKRRIFDQWADAHIDRIKKLRESSSN